MGKNVESSPTLNNTFTTSNKAQGTTNVYAYLILKNRENRFKINFHATVEKNKGPMNLIKRCRADLLHHRELHIKGTPTHELIKYLIVDINSSVLTKYSLAYTRKPRLVMTWTTSLRRHVCWSPIVWFHLKVN